MIYFDNAATTFPKPPGVINGIISCMSSYCGNPGRSGHALSMRAAEKIYDCREAISRLFNVSAPTNVVFTPNTTYALNIAINAFARKRGHVLISDVEHNSVYRAVASLSRIGVDYDIFTVDPYSDENTLRSIKNRLRSNTSLLVCAHVSNVCGITLPIEKIGGLCKKYGVRFTVDAAQSAGTHPIDMQKCNIDALCCPGHKGLYGPQGTGFVVFSDKYSAEGAASGLTPFVYGGNGVNSAEKKMPDFLPERYEGGTLNTPGIAGLSEGIDFVGKIGEDNIFRHVCSLFDRSAEMLSSLPEVEIYHPDLKGGCLLFNVKDMDSDTVADLLNDEGLCLRGGLHCSPLAHKKLKTQKGAVRASFSYFNSPSEAEALFRAVKHIAKNK